MARIVIQGDKCLRMQSKCRLCVDACPMEVLGWDTPIPESVMTSDLEDCIECRTCEVVCPEKAIKIESID